MRSRRSRQDLSPKLREGLRRLEVPEASADFDERVLGAVGTREQGWRTAKADAGSVMAIAALAAFLWAVYLLPSVTPSGHRTDTRASVDAGFSKTQDLEQYLLPDPTGYAGLNYGAP